jgi:mannose-6-phosphate isomerase-like protein (cupin superfamily)
MECSRRDLGLLLSAFLAPRNLFSSEEGVLPSKAYRFEGLPVRTNGQNTSRPILAGKTHTGCGISISENDITPGGMPHPPHHHETDQALLVFEGTFEVTIAGESTRLGPGSVAYMASNVEHGIKNVGTTHARYFSVTLGGNNT